VNITNAPVTVVATCCLGTPREISCRRFGIPPDKDERGFDIEWPAIPPWCLLPSNIPKASDVAWFPPQDQDPVI
jgi:hypothetical protein